MTPWTTSEFRAIGLALYGHGWQTALARTLGVSDRSVRRWASGAVKLPERVQCEVMDLAGMSEADWPHDEWIMGDGPELDGTRREYIVHTRPPRFVARVVALDAGEPEPGEAPVDILSGITYDAGGAMLCEVQWTDSPPPEKDLAVLMVLAGSVLAAED